MKENIKYKYIIIVLMVFVLVQLCLFNTIISISANKVDDKKSLEDGTYTISSAANDNYVFDIAGASQENGVNIALYEYNGLNHQKFKVQYLNNGTYSITAVHSGKSLDIPGSSRAEGMNVQQHKLNSPSSQNQQWIIKDNGDGTYSIISEASELYLTVNGGTARNGAGIQQYKGNNGISQKFYFEAEKGEKTLADGAYFISSAMDDNYVFDVGAASQENGVNITLYQYNGLNHQKFSVKYLNNGAYSITAVHSGKSLDIPGSSKAEGMNVQQYKLNSPSSRNQQWIIKDNGDGTYSIISKASGLYLSASGETAKNGAMIQQYKGNNQNSQKFTFEAVKGKKTIEDGTYAISSATNDSYVFDVGGASKEDTANITLYEYHAYDHEKFNVKYLNNGVYSITAVHSGKSLDVPGSQKTNGANIQQYKLNDPSSPNQQWVIKDNGDGTYSIISKCNGLYIDVAGGAAADGANIQLYQEDYTRLQKFKFEKDKKLELGEQTVADGIYSIECGGSSNYVLDIAGGSRANCANLQLYQKQAVGRQKFAVKYLGDGTYTITAVCSNKVLDVENSKLVAGANVIQYQPNNPSTKNQKWIIKNAGNGYYYIISKLNHLYLDLCGNGIFNGNNIQLHTGHGGTAQQFKFVEPLNVLDSIDTAKYPGYKEKIAALMDAHPGWNFELLYTGLRFSDVIVGETALHSRNLVPNTSRGEYICSYCGTKPYDNGSWYCASDRAVSYYMDPRNFLDDTNVFQFLDLNTYDSSSCTLAGIQNKVNGTFLQQYASSIDGACRNQNVNPYYIIARVLQEQGNKGGTTGKGMNGGDGYTYYNPFNIGASGNNESQIVANGLARAKQEGWNTMQKGLEGGIQICKNNWLENNQNTLYQNKFDIAQDGTALYSHQYMQNLMAAYNEARTMRSMYANTGTIDSNFTFIIPMYENINDVSYSTQAPSTVRETGPIDMQVTTSTYPLTIRANATTNSAKIGEVAKGGTILSVQRGINGDWNKVITTSGMIGYMSGEYLRQINDITNCNYTAYVKTADGSGCKVRIGPSIDLDKITALSDGTAVTVINQNTYNNINGYNWCRVRLSNGIQGFMPINYLK